MNEYVQGIVTVLSLVNPAICAAIFLKLQGQQAKGVQTNAAFKAMFSVFIILVLSAVLGMGVQFALSGLKNFLV